jgi:hypothetical protein
MTPILHSRHGRRRSAAGASRFSAARAIRQLSAAFKMIHDAIVAAKMRRLRSELMFSGAHESWSSERGADATKYPQRPLVLGDKWDF